MDLSYLPSRNSPSTASMQPLTSDRGATNLGGEVNGLQGTHEEKVTGADGNCDYDMNLSGALAWVWQAILACTWPWLMTMADIGVGILLRNYLILSMYVGTCWLAPAGLWCGSTCAYVRQTTRAVRQQPLTRVLLCLAPVMGRTLARCGWLPHQEGCCNDHQGPLANDSKTARGRSGDRPRGFCRCPSAEKPIQRNDPRVRTKQSHSGTNKSDDYPMQEHVKPNVCVLILLAFLYYCMGACIEGAAAGAACHFRSLAQTARRQVPLHSRTDLQCIMCDLSEHAQSRGLLGDIRVALYQGTESRRRSTIHEPPCKLNFMDLSIENDKNSYYHLGGEYNDHVISCCTVKSAQMIYPRLRRICFPWSINMSDPHPLPLGCENLRLNRVPTVHAGYTMSGGSSSDEYPPTEYAPTEAATGAEAPGLMLESMADVEALLIHDQSQDPAQRQIAWRIRPRAPSPIPEEGRPSSSSMPAPPAPRTLDTATACD